MNGIKATKKIDVHAHVCPFPEFSVPLQHGKRMPSASEQIGYYAELNIERGVLLPLVSSECHIENITSLDCKYIADANAESFLWFCGVDPRGNGNSPSADLSKIIRHYKTLGAKGVGELTAQLYADDPLMDNLFYHCALCDMPVTIHVAEKFGGTYGIVDELGLPRLEKMLKKHPELRIFGHSGCFWSEISADVNDYNRMGYPTGKVREGRLAALLREYPNLYCDLSAGSGANALMRDPDYAARFIEEFSDRLMYGTDIYAYYPTYAFEFAAFLDKMLDGGMISEENYYKLIRGNAEKQLGLTEGR